MGSEVRQGSYVLGTSSTAATLTTSYSGNVSSTMNTRRAYEVELNVLYTPGSGGSGNSVQLKVEWATPNDVSASPGSTEWYQEASESTSAGSTTLYQQNYTFTGATAGTAYYFTVSVPVKQAYLRVSAKETVVGGSAGTAKVFAVISEQTNS